MTTPWRIVNPRACPRCHCDTVGLDLKTNESVCVNCGWRAPNSVQTLIFDHRIGQLHLWLRSVSVEEIQDILAGRLECDCEGCKLARLL
jgi:hypothetical protein